MKPNHRFLLVTVLAVALSAPRLHAQGSLTPPGVPAPTMKSLDQIEPRVPISSTTTPGDADSFFRITAPGSYYAVGSATASSGRTYLEIAANHVTVDLMGFRWAGAAGSFDGIQVLPGYSNVRIVNGTLVNFGRDGIAAPTADGVHIRDVTVSGVSNIAVRVGPGGLITDCLVVSPGQVGVELGAGAMAERCSVRAGAAVAAFVGKEASRFSHCSASTIANDGFFVESGVTVDQCTVAAVAHFGVRTTTNAVCVRITDNSFDECAGGVGFTYSGAYIRGNSARQLSGGYSAYEMHGKGTRFEENHFYGDGYLISYGLGSFEDNLIVRNTAISRLPGNGEGPFHLLTSTAHIFNANYIGVDGFLPGWINKNSWANFGHSE